MPTNKLNSQQTFDRIETSHLNVWCRFEPEIIPKVWIDMVNNYE